MRLTLTATLALLAGCEKLDQEAWAIPNVYGVANIDDDNENGTVDWDDASGDTSGDNDLATFSLPPELFTGMGEESKLKLSFDTPNADVRVWRDGEVVLDHENTSKTVNYTESTTVFKVEFANFLAEATVTVTGVDTAGDEQQVSKVTLLSSPLILNHHLQPAEQVVAMESTGFGNNTEFIQDITVAIDQIFDPIDISPFGGDVWIQDEIEFATLYGPENRIDLVIDSVRSQNDQYLDDFPEQILVEPDTTNYTWGLDDGRVTSQDSFGNLEVTPPVTVDGVYYPFGRIYWGENSSGMGSNSWGITDSLADMLADQKIQAPFQLDISWLCVGHVDEFISWVPDTSSDKGFKMILADTEVGYEFLESLPSDLSLPQYRSDHGFASVGDILNDSALRALNDELQVDYIEPNVEILMREAGLTEEDIIRIPAVYEKYPGCQGATISLIPGTVNMLVAHPDGFENPQILMPDPFLREGSQGRNDDPFIAEIEGMLPDGLDFNWVDDWDSYHIMMGEVHCGSNTRRTPTDNWWESGLHLLGGE